MPRAAATIAKGLYDGKEKTSMRVRMEEKLAFADNRGKLHSSPTSPEDLDGQPNKRSPQDEPCRIHPQLESQDGRDEAEADRETVRQGRLC